MINGFVFNTIRGSVASEHEMVLRLYCVGNNLSVDDIRACYKDKDKTNNVDIRCSISPLDGTEKIKKCYPDATNILDIYIPVLSDMSDNAVLQVERGNAEGEEKRVIYTCSILKIRQIMSKVNYKVTDIDKSDGNLVVSGYAVDVKDITFSITRKKYKKKINLDYSLEWCDFPDINSIYPEYTGDGKACFVLTMKNEKSSMSLRVDAGKRSSVYRFRGIKKYSRYEVVNKASRYMYRGIYSLNQEGVGETIKKVGKRFSLVSDKEVSNYDKWISDKMPGKSELATQRNKAWDKAPCFSVIALNNTVNSVFTDSLEEQTYKNFQLCMGDSLDEAVKKAEGEYLVFAFPDMCLMPNALYECATIISNKKVDFIYSDNDKKDIKTGEVKEPHFKSDYNIDLLRSYNYIRYPLAISAEIFKKADIEEISDIMCNPYNANLWFAENSENIVHIPKILYRCLVEDNHANNNIESVDKHLKRCGISADVCKGETDKIVKVNYHLSGNPLVSIIIPNKDHISDLKRCMDSIDNLSEYKDYEYVIVENNSTETETFEFYREIVKRDNVNVVCWEDEFNYSAINNYGVLAARGEYLLLLNNDTSIINPDCISQLLSYCQREEVGIVGARLYYDDETIQHAGVIIGLGGIAGHAFVGQEASSTYMDRAISACDYSAVTAACLMIKKSVFEAVDGLDEQFKVAFNDSDLCLKVRELNKLVVYNANAKLYHYESKSRGAEDTPEKQDRFQDEIELFYEKWNSILKDGDPYFNKNLSLDKTDFSLKK